MQHNLGSVSHSNQRRKGNKRNPNWKALPYALKIANLGAEAACKADPALMKGLNTYNGHLTFKAVAEAQDLTYTDPKELF